MCVSVIDENDNKFVDGAWSTLKSIYPDRPLCVLQPWPPYSNGILSLPTDFYTDVNSNVFSEVTRNPEDATNPSDWWDICGLEALRRTGLRRVLLFVDESGSMDRFDVQTSLDLFVAAVESAGMEVVDAVYNGDEDYIHPCYQTHLVDFP